jgi:hypothetical protein
MVLLHLLEWRRQIKTFGTFQAMPADEEGKVECAVASLKDLFAC